MSEKKKFNAYDFYVECFEESEKFIPVPKWLKPIIVIAIMKVHEMAYNEGLKRGKTLAEIRHINWAKSKGKEFFDVYFKENFQ